ncbi:hypothetical protein SprV_0702430100 [Sparganum proliferum]
MPFARQYSMKSSNKTDPTQGEGRKHLLTANHVAGLEYARLNVIHLPGVFAHGRRSSQRLPAHPNANDITEVKIQAPIPAVGPPFQPSAQSDVLCQTSFTDLPAINEEELTQSQTGAVDASGQCQDSSIESASRTEELEEPVNSKVHQFPIRCKGRKDSQPESYEWQQNGGK